MGPHLLTFSVLISTRLQQNDSTVHAPTQLNLRMWSRKCQGSGLILQHWGRTYSIFYAWRGI